MWFSSVERQERLSPIDPDRAPGYGPRDESRGFMVLLIPFIPLILIGFFIGGVHMGFWEGFSAYGWVQGTLLIGGLVTTVGAIIYGVRKRSIPSMWWGVAASILLGTAGALFWQSQIFPPITDYSSDFQNPPAFSAIAALPENQGRDYTFPAQNSLLIHQAFPREMYLITELAMGEVMAAAKQIIELNEWDLVSENADQGLLEAVVTSRMFMLKDDFIVRVKPEGNGVRVDFRSKSRQGEADLGANALRIMRFKRALENALQKKAS